MTRAKAGVFLGLTAGLLFTIRASADEPKFERKEDVIYGRKYGTALTMDVFTPLPRARANGIGIVFVVSGGWSSTHDLNMTPFVGPLVDRGYTVFSVVHGSQPKFTIPEIAEDLNRAVRFIRYHAKDYAIDPDRIGIYGASAGGHLSLLQGTAGNAGNPEAKDPVNRTSSRVQAVACLYPPTDFLNYGKEGVNALGKGILEKFKAPFDFHEHDKNINKFVPIVDEAAILELGRKISPAHQVTPDDPPALIVHGDADALVPIQQSELIVAKLKQAGVDAKLIVKPGAKHGWPGQDQDLLRFADWFDQHLKKTKTVSGARNDSGTPGKTPSL